MNLETELTAMTKKEVISFIREKLTTRFQRNGGQYKEKLCFEFSGYEVETGGCTLHNQMVLNKFADLGIYDYTHFLVVDFYKGIPSLYLRYFQTGEYVILEDELSGYTTSEIIYEVFRYTILSGRNTRRRS